VTSKRHVKRFTLGVSDGTHTVTFVDTKDHPQWKKHPHRAGRFDTVSRRTLTDKVNIGSEYRKALAKDGLTVAQAQRLGVLLAAGVLAVGILIFALGMLVDARQERENGI